MLLSSLRYTARGGTLPSLDLKQETSWHFYLYLYQYTHSITDYLSLLIYSSMKDESTIKLPNCPQFKTAVTANTLPDIIQHNVSLLRSYNSAVFDTFYFAWMIKHALFMQCRSDWRWKWIYMDEFRERENVSQYSASGVSDIIYMRLIIHPENEFQTSLPNRIHVI